MEALLLLLFTGCVHLCIVQDSILKEFVGGRVEPIQRTSSCILEWREHVQPAAQTVELRFGGTSSGTVEERTFLPLWMITMSLKRSTHVTTWHALYCTDFGARVSRQRRTGGYAHGSFWAPVRVTVNITFKFALVYFVHDIARVYGSALLSFRILKGFGPVVQSGFLMSPTATLCRTRRRKIHAVLGRNPRLQRLWILLVRAQRGKPRPRCQATERFTT